MNPLATGWIETLAVMLGVVVIATRVVHAGGATSQPVHVKKSGSSENGFRWNTGIASSVSPHEWRQNLSVLSKLLSW